MLKKILILLLVCIAQNAIAQSKDEKVNLKDKQEILKLLQRKRDENWKDRMENKQNIKDFTGKQIKQKLVHDKREKNCSWK